MIYIIYDILLFLAYVAYLPIYAFRGRLHADLVMRLGFFKKDFFRTIAGKDVVWIHAVSVGEARASESLLRLIRSRWPHKRIAVSTVTPTGYAIVKKLLKENEVAFYAPLDISFAVSRVLRCVAPSLLIIMETEIWPNLIRLAKKRGCKIAIVNGRISDRSFERYHNIRSLLRRILEKVDVFCMQTQESARRIISLGAEEDRVTIAGNIKFDISGDVKEPEVLNFLKQALNGALVFIAGSTHEGEEEGILTVYKSLKKDFTTLRLILAPRHLERVDKIRRHIRLEGLEALNLSRFAGGKITESVSCAQVLILDTIGDLSALFRLSDIAYIGGSLVPRGGHNPIEPALFGKPILFGNHMDNFREIRDIFIRERAAVEVTSFGQLEYEMRKLAASLVERKTLGARAQSLIDTHRGASQRTFDVLETLVKE